MNLSWTTAYILSALGIATACLGQEFPHDPGLLKKIYSAEFNSIEPGQETAFGLGAIIMGFSNSGCSLSSDQESSSMQEVMSLTNAMAQEAGPSIYLMPIVQVHPSYQEAVVMAGTGGCESSAVQSTMSNLVKYLRIRYN